MSVKTGSARYQEAEGADQKHKGVNTLCISNALEAKRHLSICSSIKIQKITPNLFAKRPRRFRNASLRLRANVFFHVLQEKRVLEQYI